MTIMTTKFGLAKKLLLVLAASGFYGPLFAASTASAPAAASSKAITVKLAEGLDCGSETPCNVINTSAVQLSQAINNNLSDKQAFNLIQNSIMPQFDFNLMTKLAMGANWKNASADQQGQIVNLFKQQLLYSYSTALSKFKGAQVAITSSSIIGDKQNKSVVNSTIALPSNGNSSNQPVNIEYDLAKIANNWKIYDVKIEHASIVTTYRSQFNDIIQNNGVNGLISQLQTKVDNLKSVK